LHVASRDHQRLVHQTGDDSADASAPFAGDLSPSTIRTAMIMGSAIGSFAVEKLSTGGIVGLSTAQIQQRFAKLAELAHFERVRL
jgi:hypothetical protein